MEKLRKNIIYENCKVFSREGKLIFLTSQKRANWYLKKGLAQKLEGQEFSIQLIIETRGPGGQEDNYSTTCKENKCVVCGSEHVPNLTKHHVVPKMYRKFINPGEYKDFHDVLPLCRFCHAEYEQKADELKLQLSEQYQVVKPIHFKHLDDNKKYIRVVKKAYSLLNFGDRIPDSKKEEILKEISEFLNKEVEESDIVKLASQKPFVEKNIMDEHSKGIIQKLDDIQSFVEMWREHFLVHSQPKHLPEFWNVKRNF